MLRCGVGGLRGGSHVGDQKRRVASWMVETNMLVERKQILQVFEHVEKKTVEVGRTNSKDMSKRSQHKPELPREERTTRQKTLWTNCNTEQLPHFSTVLEQAPSALHIPYQSTAHCFVSFNQQHVMTLGQSGLFCR